MTLYLMRGASQGKPIYLLKDHFLKGKKPNTKAWHHLQRRVATQGISPQNNFRRLISCIIQEGEFCNHAIDYYPENECTLPLEFLLFIFNSKLADWYFRIGSTNQNVAHYQTITLPCPVFRGNLTAKETAIGKKVAELLTDSKPESALSLLAPLLETAPFSPVLIDTVVMAVDRIVETEKRRGSMSRSDRSALSSKAQPFQDFLDELFFAMAGLTPDEVTGLRSRYKSMK